MVARALRLLVAVVLAVGALAPGAATAERTAPPSGAEVDRAAGALAERLVAPCCWRESLRSHPSPLADELRAELHARLAGGESADAIERDLVRRYGARIRAFSPDWDPRWTIGAIAGVVIVGALGLVVLWGRRQRRRGAPPSVASPAPATDERLEELLDDELSRADD